MKRNTIQIFIILQFVFLLLSCDYTGNLLLINGYEYNVMVHSFYDYNTTILEQFKEFYPGLPYPPVTADWKYSNITAIFLETTDGTVLANYTPEYLMLLRKVYTKKQKRFEYWIFTEKGLFLITNEIRKRYKWDNEKIFAYYRTDEAVQDLQVLLKKE